MVTAVCNIYINSEEKFGLFKETFPLVYLISDNWLIYIRGKFKNEVVEYIETNFSGISNNCVFFDNLYINDWARSTRMMLKSSKYQYVYVFLEDHFLQTSINHFRSVLAEMINNNIDYFLYSFFKSGLSINSIEHLYPNVLRYFHSILVYKKDLPTLQKTNISFYLHSLSGVSSMKYFKQLLDIEDKIIIRVPTIIQGLMENIYFLYPRNRVLLFKINKFVSKIGIRFVIYPSTTPFNLEKSLFDCNEELLPLKVGILKEELFANWDDDNKVTGTSLIKRGLYPKPFRVIGKNRPKQLNRKEYILAKGEQIEQCFCPDVPRTKKIPTKFIYVKKGDINILSDNESINLKTGQSAWIYANKYHTLKGYQDSLYQLYYDY